MSCVPPNQMRCVFQCSINPSHNPWLHHLESLAALVALPHASVSHLLEDHPKEFPAAFGPNNEEIIRLKFFFTFSVFQY